MSELASAFALSSMPAGVGSSRSASSRTGNIYNLPRNYYHANYSRMASTSSGGSHSHSHSPFLPAALLPYPNAAHFASHYPQMDRSESHSSSSGSSYNPPPYFTYPTSGRAPAVGKCSQSSCKQQYASSIKYAAAAAAASASSTKPLYFSILGDLSRLYAGTTIDPDFTIHTAGGKAHRAHRFVLMFRSRYFESLFRSGLVEAVNNEMTIDDVTGEVMDAIIRYIYLGTFVYERMEQLMELIIAADRFLLEDLVAALNETILKEISPETALAVFKMAETFNFETIYDKAEEYILDHGYLMLREAEFAALPPEEVKYFLANDRFCTVEDEVVSFLLEYVKNQELEPKMVGELFGTVRFAMLIDAAKMLTSLDPTDTVLFEMIVAKYDQAHREAEVITKLKEKAKATQEISDQLADCYPGPSSSSSSSFLTPQADATTTSEDHDDTLSRIPSLPFRTCYHSSDLKLLFPQFGDTFDNGFSTIVSMAPTTLTLTFSTKSAFDRIYFYIRCLYSVHIWFEWTNDEEPDGGKLQQLGDPAAIKDNREWHAISDTNTWGHNQAFTLALSRIHFARAMRMQLRPVTGDVGTFPLSLYNLSFSLAFPQQDLVPKFDIKQLEGGNENVNSFLP